MPTLLGTWNPTRGVWETDRVDLYGRSELFSETWPASGTTRAGTAYALPTPAHRTPGSACSSSPGRPEGLLQTPLTTTADGVQVLERQVGGRGSPMLPTPLVSDRKGLTRPSAGREGTPQLRDVVHAHLLPTPDATHGRETTRTGPLLAGAVQLLPTPQWADGDRESLSMYRGTENPTLKGALVALLPTPKATDGTKGGPNQRGSSGDLMLPSAVAQLLPTPTAMDSSGSRGHRLDGTPYGATSGTTLTDAAYQLLPTPSVADVTGGHRRRSGTRSEELLLPGLVEEITRRSSGDGSPPPSPPGRP